MHRLNSPQGRREAAMDHAFDHIDPAGLGMALMDVIDAHCSFKENAEMRDGDVSVAVSFVSLIFGLSAEPIVLHFFSSLPAGGGHEVAPGDHI